ncbi:hypothetical protein SAMN06269250_1575 [Spirosoma fluviale]|uniref:Uncharacterized protein n=2 Tax=Spirosoma fluviale TaxID=1597977 RepID=A0A286FC96_9BACT|nr:hypothetical protein SAMN06269250_1575 [Spirosoma fluviale]
MMCRTSPCFPTPKEAISLIQRGYQDQLQLTIYTDQKTERLHSAITPKFDQKLGCTFQNRQGLCELHSLGLKPTEGRLAHHSLADDGLRVSVCDTWETQEGIDVIKNFPDSDQEWKNLLLLMLTNRMYVKRART